MAVNGVKEKRSLLGLTRSLWGWTYIVMEKLAVAVALRVACSRIANKRLHTHTRATKAAPFYLCDTGMKVRQVVTKG